MSDIDFLTYLQGFKVSNNTRGKKLEALHRLYESGELKFK